jgi:hypothetical protein
MNALSKASIVLVGVGAIIGAALVAQSSLAGPKTPPAQQIPMQRICPDGFSATRMTNGTSVCTSAQITCPPKQAPKVSAQECLGCGPFPPGVYVSYRISYYCQ